MDCDQRISWPEFQYRFAGGLDPRLKVKIEKKITIELQSPRKQTNTNGGANANGANGGGKFSLLEMKAILDALYSDGSRRYKSIDTAKYKTVTPATLKKLLNLIVTTEKETAKKGNREVEEWASKPIEYGGVNQKEIDRLFASWDEKKQGRVDLDKILEAAKIKSSGKGANSSEKEDKKKKKNEQKKRKNRR